MVELLASIADRKPDEVALVDEFGETSWRSCDERTNRLLSALGERGLAPGRTIAVMSGNRRELFEMTAAVAHGSWIAVPPTKPLSPRGARMSHRTRAWAPRGLQAPPQHRLRRAPAALPHRQALQAPAA